MLKTVECRQCRRRCSPSPTSPSASAPSSEYVYRAIREGRLPALALGSSPTGRGRLLRIRPRDLKQWLREHEQEVAALPRSISTRRVFNIEGRPISWVYLAGGVAAGARKLAELAYRPPYNLRHTFAYWSLRAGVPIASVAREMGHTSTEQTFRVYGGWCREMGADAAAMRTAWAKSEAGGTIAGPAAPEGQ